MQLTLVELEYFEAFEMFFDDVQTTLLTRCPGFLGFLLRLASGGRKWILHAFPECVCVCVVALCVEVRQCPLRPGTCR